MQGYGIAGHVRFDKKGERQGERLPFPFSPTTFLKKQAGVLQLKKHLGIWQARSCTDVALANAEMIALVDVVSQALRQLRR